MTTGASFSPRLGWVPEIRYGLRLVPGGILGILSTLPSSRTTAGDSDHPDEERAQCKPSEEWPGRLLYARSLTHRGAILFLLQNTSQPSLFENRVSEREKPRTSDRMRDTVPQ
jgi:hypothetical protein